MKLFYYQDPLGNFGDDLNAWLWPRLIPDLLDGDPACLFVGIGSILDGRIPDAPEKVVFGTGIGFGRLPAVDARWQICCVRGPLSARALGLPPALAITDAATLVRTVYPRAATPRYPVAFIPNFRTPARAAAAGLDLPAVCQAAGVQYIDPSAPVPAVLALLAASRLVLAEAMHGAIVADALRVPWIPVQLYDHVRPLKWHDWCSALGLAYRPQVWPGAPGGAGAESLAAFLAGVLRRGPAELSADAVLDRATAQLQERLAGLAPGCRAAGAFRGHPRLVPDPEVLRSVPWLYEIQQALAEIAAHVPPGSSFILADQAQWGGGEMLAGRRTLPFLAREGMYWGLPPDGATAVQELARMRAAGADFFVLAAPAFWWLDYYTGLGAYLGATARLVSESARVRIYDLRPAPKRDFSNGRSAAPVC